MKRNLKLMFALAMVLSFVLSACAPAAAPSTPAATTVPPTPVTIVVTQQVIATAAPQPDRVQVYWYIGLGAGAQPANIPLEKAFVDKYNSTQGAKDGIQLIPIIVDNKYATDNLTAQLAAGNAPDIVGPVGTAGRASFPGAFLDLQPYVDKYGYDASDVDPAFLNFYKVDGQLTGLPFAIYPSAVYFNKALFDQAGLAYPPQKVGDKYNLDGKDVEWNFDTLAEVGRRLTVDKNGNDATSPKFDAKNIVQYGFDFQWVRDDPRWYTAYFEPHYPVVNGKADLSAGQIAGIKWYYDAIFGKQPFAPSQAAIDSDLLGKGNTFGSGKVAMALTHTWYTCCVDPKVITSWDVGIVPSYNGKITAKMHADSFGIMKDSKHPDEAYKAYSYMLGAGASELYPIYGALPAHKSEQAAFFTNLDKTFAPNKVDWQVFLDMIPYLDVPDHQLGLPNNNAANAVLLKLGSDLRSNPNLDVDKRLADFMTEFNAVLTAAPTPTP